MKYVLCFLLIAGISCGGDSNTSDKQEISNIWKDYEAVQKKALPSSAAGIEEDFDCSDGGTIDVQSSSSEDEVAGSISFTLTQKFNACDTAGFIVDGSIAIDGSIVSATAELTLSIEGSVSISGTYTRDCDIDISIADDSITGTFCDIDVSEFE